jgi:gluconolactonase
MKTALTALAAALLPASPASAQSLQPGEVAADVTDIAGVVSGAAEWQQVWSGPMAADGLATTPDGLILFAQEQSNAIWKLWPDGQSFAEYPFVLGAGAVAVDGNGRVFTVERGCTDPGLTNLTCDRPTRVVELGATRRVVADHFADGSSLGRLNDLHADGQGGAWFTQGELYHAASDGTVTLTADVSVFSNGVVASPDGRTLYVTDRTSIVALDVAPDLTTSNQRVFATLTRDTQGFGGDGLEVDNQGRLYVTGDAGVYVFAPDGTQLGVIPAPRRTITLSFAGPDRNVLYVGALGAVTPAGELWTTPEGVRNIAMTIYRLDMLASGIR